MSTNWTRLYGPIVAPDNAAHDILTAPVNVAYVLTKFTVSNVTASAATATITFTPFGGVAAQVVEKVIPGFPTVGGIVEIVELEGQIMNPGDKITFTDGTGASLAPMISGTAYTP